MEQTPILYRIEMLGGLRIRHARRLLPRFKTYKTGALLAYLVYHCRQDTSRETLIEMFWPDHSGERARNNLSAALSEIRSLLEAPDATSRALVMADRYQVRLDPERIATDVSEFLAALPTGTAAADETEQIKRTANAIDLYQGELLPGYYEDWILAERQHLAELYLQALRRLMLHHARRKEVQSAIHYAQRAVSADSTREEAHQDLIRLFLATDQVSAARQQVAEMMDALGRIGIESPSATSRRLLREIEAARHAEPTSIPVRQVAQPREAAAAEDETQPRPPTSAEPRPPPFASSTPETIPSRPQPLRGGVLPISFTRFIGRQTELQRLLERLEQEHHRLITLFGPGGVGKTRLALEAAARLQTDGARSVWFVSLADLSDPTYLAQAIADGLCLPHVPQVDPLEQIITALTAQPAVLILDNFEHLVTDGAALVTTLLTRAPQLQILVTSRKLLGLLAELEFALAPMPVPEPCNTPERLIRYESVQLFLDRAQAVRPNFCMNPNNTADIGALCERLEGLPLAIELAAARTVVLAPAQMLKQLEDRFKLLAGGRQDLPERQRTLRATLDWSYSLLGVGLRTFFARLSVFRGSWTLEAAEKVCAEPLALDLLAELRACSLIQTLESDRQIRFRMLETVREFAALYLPVEERDRWQQQHLDYFLAFAEEAARQEGQPPHDARDDDAPAAPIDQTASIETASIETASIETASIETTSIETTSIEQEQENLRAALARAAPAEAEKQVRLANALFPYWRRRGHYREGRRWLEPAEAEGLPLTARTRAASLHNAGTLALLQGDDATAERLLERCLALHRTLGEAAGEAAALMNLGDLALRADQPERAEACFRSSLELRRQREDWIGVADVLVWLGNLAQRRGNLAEAQHLYGESLVFYQRGNVSAPCALVLNNLGVLAYEQEQYEAALACYDRCLEYYGLTGDRAERARTLNNRGNALRALGRVAEAEAVLVESLTLWHELENPAEAALTNNTLGLTHCARGDHVAARRCLMASWLFYQRRMDREGLAYTLTGLAEVALGEGRPIKALRLLVQAQRERADLHCVLPPGDQRDWDRALLGVLAALPESEFLAIWHGDNPLLPARQPSIAP